MNKKYDFRRENFPHWFYKRVPVLHSTEYVFFKLDYGFHFLLTHCIEKHNESFGGVNFACPDLNAQIIRVGSSDHFHNAPVYFPLFASPGQAGVDANLVEHNMSATPLKIPRKLDYFFPFSDTVQIEITGQTINSAVNPELNFPGFIDILLIGRYYPEHSLEGMAS